MQRTVLRCQAEENQHISPLMDDLQDALDRCVLGFSGSFPMNVGRNNLPYRVIVSSTLLTSRCSGKMFEHDLTNVKDFTSTPSAPLSFRLRGWVGGARTLLGSEKY